MARPDAGDPRGLDRAGALAYYDVLDGRFAGELDDIAQLAAQLVGTSCAAVNLLDHAHQHQVGVYGLTPSVCTLEESMCTLAVRTEQAQWTPDARDDDRYRHNAHVDGRLDRLRFYAATVLMSPSNLPIGTLCVFDREPGHLTEGQQRALRTLGRQVTDLLELRKNTGLLRDSLAELSRSHEHLAAFAAQISHDLKTPLTSLLGFSQLLQENDSVRADPAASTWVDRCVSSGRRMLELIDDVLDFATVGGALHLVPVSLADVMSEIVADIGPLADEADISFDEQTVVADRAQLRLLLQNLVTNAVRYRRPDVRAQIHVSAAKLPRGVAIRVVDNGVGIPPEARRDVVAPLTRLDTSMPGTGLGLATVERITEAHGGLLHIGETPGGGTTVRVLLAEPDDLPPPAADRARWPQPA